jgi:uncharacterized protein involved in oxidation of intracellular sulfur
MGSFASILARPGLVCVDQLPSIGQVLGGAGKCADRRYHHIFNVDQRRIMQNLLIIINAAPYGSERCLSALRLATALAGNDSKPAIRIFLMSDATVLGLPNQIDGAGNGLQGMVEGLVAQGVDIRLCRTCALARGLGELPLIPGTSIGTLVELAEATLLADKVVTF